MPFDFDPQRYPTTPGCYLMRDAGGRVIYPRFNRKLMPEDTGYHYIVLTDEPLPRLLLYRKQRINGSSRIYTNFDFYP